MRVTETKPVPIYEATCSECKSRIEYKAAEVSFTGYITCPVCGKSVYAGILCPVGYEYPDASFPSNKDGEEIIDPCGLVKELAEKIGIHQLYAIMKDMRGE